MYWLENIYSFFHSFFELISLRTKPKYNSLNDVENPVDYEFVILNEPTQQIMNR